MVTPRHGFVDSLVPRTSAEGARRDTGEEVRDTIEAAEILRKRIDGNGGWLSIPEVGRSIRISAILRLEREARLALTGHAG